MRKLAPLASARYPEQVCSCLRRRTRLRFLLPGPATAKGLLAIGLVPILLRVIDQVFCCYFGVHVNPWTCQFDYTFVRLQCIAETKEAMCDFIVERAPAAVILLNPQRKQEMLSAKCICT